MKYELKKLFSSVYVLVCLLLLIAFTAYFVVQSYQSRDTSLDSYTAIINEFAKEYPDSEKLTAALSQKRYEVESRVNSEGDNAFNIQGEYGENLMSDFLLLTKAENYANYIYDTIPKTRTRIIKESLYKASDTRDGYMKTKYLTAAEKYNVVVDCKFTNTGDLDSEILYFDFTVWDYAMIAFVIMLTVRMFTLDRESGAYKSVYSSYYGKGRLFANQFSACVFVGFVTVILHTVCQLICGAVFYGVTDFSLPIQSYQTFNFCPFNITVGEYFLIKTAGKLLMILSVTALTAMLTAITRKTVPSLVFSLIIAVGEMLVNTKLYLTAYDTSGSLLNGLREFSFARKFLPACLLKPDEYFKSMDYICVSGTAVPRFFCVIAVTFAISVVCTWVSYKAFVKVRRV